jgi:hypothetical protein
VKATPRCPSPTLLCDRASIMATLASSPPTSPSWPKRSPRAWALRCERYCCAAASCFPLAFVYGLTTWAVYVEASIGLKVSRSDWIGMEGVHTPRRSDHQCLMRDEQVFPAQSSELCSTVFSTLVIPSPSLRTPVRHCPRAAAMAGATTARFQLPNPISPTSHRTLLAPRDHRVTARNVSARSRTAHTTARRANGAY